MKQVSPTVSMLALAVLAGPVSGQDSPKPNPGTVTVYCSIDEQFGRQVLETFRKRTGVNVLSTFDMEAGKTTGLYNRIIAEQSRPRADVFWSSELFNTILLGRKGLLKPYRPQTAGDIPDRYKDERHHWTANALRARVLAFNPDQGNPEQGKIAWEDLGRPYLAKYTSMANPLFGTTRGHVAAMFATWGPERGRKFLKDFRDGGGHIADGNSASLRMVIAGRRPFAATDSDDVFVARTKGEHLGMIYPDMGDGGTLLIPCSVALIAGRPDNQAAKKLVDFLVSEDVERLLAESDSRNFPVRQALRNRLDRQLPPESTVDYQKIADALEEAMTAVREILLQ